MGSALNAGACGPRLHPQTGGGATLGGAPIGTGTASVMAIDSIAVGPKPPQHAPGTIMNAVTMNGRVDTTLPVTVPDALQLPEVIV